MAAMFKKQIIFLSSEKEQSIYPSKTSWINQTIIDH
jgi:hypothetical protein